MKTGSRIAIAIVFLYIAFTLYNSLRNASYCDKETSKDGRNVQRVASQSNTTSPASLALLKKIEIAEPKAENIQTENAWVKRKRVLNVKEWPFDLHNRLPAQFSFSPFADIDILVNFTSIQRGENNQLSYQGSGEIIDKSGTQIGTAFLSYATEKNLIGISGRFGLNSGELYVVKYNTNDSILVEEEDVNKYPGCITVSPKVDNNSSANKIDEQKQIHAQDSIKIETEAKMPKFSNDSYLNITTRAENTVPTTNIKILVAYTEALENTLGGQSATQVVIDNAILVTNQIYINSAVNIRLERVHSEKVIYEETTFSNDLQRLTNGQDGYMDNIPILRDRYEADVTTLFVKNAELCGTAYMLLERNLAYANYAYSVVNADCATSTYSLAHEIGHNMGADHDRNNASQDYAHLASYGYGYRFGPAPEHNAYRTIMAYAPGMRIPNFSNPNILYQGYSTGIFETEASSSNVSLLLNEISPFIASYRGKNRISGTVYISSRPVSGVRIEGGILGVKYTDSNGQYSFDDLATGTAYTISAKLNNEEFAPTSASGTVSGEVTQNFSAVRKYSISGTVKFAEAGLDAVDLEVNGSVQTTTDATGQFRLSNITENTNLRIIPKKLGYIFSPTSSELKLTKDANISFVASLNTSNEDDDLDGLSNEEEMAIGTSPTNKDSDGDGIDDSQEIADGSNPLDTGSSLQTVNSSFCSDWNGFLGGMWNIMEHTNSATQKINISSKLYSSSGVGVELKNFSVNPGSQTDLIVHNMKRRLLNSSGLICSSHNGAPGAINGRMVYYKPSSSKGTSIEFAFAMPFNNIIKGAQYVSFNTFQPSLNSNDLNNFVANWLQIGNPSNKKETTVLSLYSVDGNLLKKLKISLNPKQKIDYPVHRLGKSMAGMASLIPTQATTSLMLRNTRYFYNGKEGIATKAGQEHFKSALTTEGIKGTGEVIVAPADIRNTMSVIEISNVLSEKVRVNVSIYASDGNYVRSKIVKLQSYSSHHLILNSLNLAKDLYSIGLKSNVKNSLIASVIQYGYKKDKGLLYAYGMPMTQLFKNVLTSSYNTFLNQKCNLLLLNQLQNQQNVLLSMTSDNGTNIVNKESISIPSHGVVDYDICSRDTADKYGIVKIESQANSVYGTLVRKGKNNSYMFATKME